MPTANEHPVLVVVASVTTMMIKTSILSLFLASSVSAFAPATTNSKSATTTALAAFESEIGATPVNGEVVCWDPLNFCSTQDDFDKFRALEVKHGRVAMLAFVGYATTWHTDYRFPGCADFPGGHEAVLKIAPVDLLAPIFAICGMLELAVFKQKDGSFPGDMGGGKFPVGFGPKFTEGFDETEIRTKELLNGRCAMMGWLSMMVHEQLDGKPFIFFDKIEPYFPGPLAL